MSSITHLFVSILTWLLLLFVVVVCKNVLTHEYGFDVADVNFGAGIILGMLFIPVFNWEA